MPKMAMQDLLSGAHLVQIPNPSCSPPVTSHKEGTGGVWGGQVGLCWWGLGFGRLQWASWEHVEQGGQQNEHREGPLAKGSSPPEKLPEPRSQSPEPAVAQNHRKSERSPVPSPPGSGGPCHLEVLQQLKVPALCVHKL